MARRDVLAEIIEKRGRGSAGASRIEIFGKRIKQLDAAMKDLLATSDANSETPHPELGRYFPTALVASIEGYFRMAVADLIDHGTPFIERIGKLRDISVSVEAAAAIQTKKISLGEYVAHFLSFSSLDDINRSLTSLLGFDFLEHLVTSEFHLYDNEPPIQLVEARRDFVVAVKELFRTRHMLCHELVPELQINHATLIPAFTATDALVSLSEVIIWAQLQAPAGEASDVGGAGDASAAPAPPGSSSS